MFVNRERELAFLQDRYHSGQAELIFISGRRRTGKTTLLNWFCQQENRSHIFFLADIGAEETLLRRFSQRLWAFAENHLPGPDFTFGQWDEAFLYLGRLGRERRVVAVLDEFPYLIQANPAVPSILQRVWDETLKYTQLQLILSGSNLAVMQQLIEYRSPLYGRRTGQWLLQPLSPWHAGQMFPDYNARQRVEAYAALGGVPAYLEQFDGRRSVMYNIEHHILHTGAMLYEEPRGLLISEPTLRDPSTYFAILRAIASGTNTVTAMARAAGKPGASHITRHLDVLQNRLHLIRRETPLGPEPPLPRARGRWRLTDPFLTFWFTFVYPNGEMLERGEAATVWREYVRPIWPQYVGRTAWETIAREYAWELARQGRLPFRLHRVGDWWTRQHQIDLAAVNDQEHRAFLAEVKWWTRPVGQPVLDGLQTKAQHWLAQATQDTDWDVTYGLLAPAFTADLHELARRRDDLLLVAVEDVMART